MLTANQLLEPPSRPSHTTTPLNTTEITVELTYDQRQKSRFRCRSIDGQDIAFLLPRGKLLRHNDRVATEQNDIIRVIAANEPVTTAHADSTDDSSEYPNDTNANALLIARASYHLGNRHVALQISTNWIRFQRDHVLADMVAQLGLRVEDECAPFEPEAGAYHSHQSNHSHQSHHSHP